MAPTTDVLSWRGQNALDADGDKIGSIEEIYLDAETNEPEWALVNTGMFGTKRSFVPIQNASPSNGDGVRLPFDKATVKDAPKVDPDGRLSPQEEAELYRHYGLDYSEPRGGNGVVDDAERGGNGVVGDAERGGPGQDVSGPNTDDAMTRSEEELTVGKTQREAGRVRLKKYVVEEQVTQTVPVRREEVRLEREPITDANAGAATDGPAISEEEHEVVLHAEEPVAEKRTIPKERVRLDKDVHEEEHEVGDTVRKERIDVDDSGAR
jgi:uncharacterized protein (TIGR02271 family)